MGAATSPALDTLLACVYRHYPRGIESGDPRHHETVESRRLACVHEAAAIACAKDHIAVSDDERVAIDEDVRTVLSSLRAWTEFGRRIRLAFPDRVVWDESGPFFEPGYRYSVADAEYVHPSKRWRDPVICAVSVLAPVYVLYSYITEDGEPARARYSAFPDRYHGRIDTLSRLAEECFGFHRLDEEIVRTPVPDVAPYGSNRVMSKSTLMDCLFLSHP